PACYRNGGPLCLTDANVLLGRIQADSFPHVFGPNGDLGLDTDAVAARFAELAAEIASAGEAELTPTEIADGFVKIAVQNMAAAIEQISVQRGHDITRFALACFGGAGGQHACRVADALGIDTVLVDPLSGVLSAYGIGVAEMRTISTAAVQLELGDDAIEAIGAAASRLAAELRAGAGRNVRLEYRLLIRADGSDTPIAVPFDDSATAASLGSEFNARHELRFGFAVRDTALIADALEAEAISIAAPPERSEAIAGTARDETRSTREIWFDGEWRETPIRRRETLTAGIAQQGPALIVEDNATIVVEPGWQAVTGTNGMLVLTRRRPRDARERIETAADPVMLEIFNNQFINVATQMGGVLEQTAHSVNIKERLDYSCAVFDGDGRLIANAPHVPVHLGSMGDSVRAVIDSAGRMAPGDAYLLNAPYRGGTHLPDLTVVMPVFESSAPQPSFYVASRAHHADIGGTTPGSMPALSRHIDEEGVVIEPVRILERGVLAEAEIKRLLAAGKYPARNPKQNIADLKAQVAANVKGAQQIAKLLERYGSAVVHAYMRHVRDNAEACARDLLRGLEPGSFAAEMDGGERIAVDIAIDRDRGEARFDFSASSGVSDGNLNAPLSVVRAVVLYVLRSLITEDIPLNAGCLVPVEIVVPAPSLLNPAYPAAVAGGNVETSQCIADVLLAALGAAAASQGTMNNFTFGDATHQYYETICGGCGAGPGFAGASAVHSHMTNSRLTDVEVLEQRYPVRLRRFAIRRGSGGSGRCNGGDGVVREFEFLTDMHGSLLASRRRVAPFGIAGGGPGQCGRDTVVRVDGTEERLPGAAEIRFNAGDRIVIETPGGGAYGATGET
ncbi:MAG: hydantoinase B/oxoprolinase family protein, partial [Gammaproteobacteria bacterium]|nr:hydantoinase B/oxoprolinase family protein [Gammaproteobacteria bacterium]